MGSNMLGNFVRERRQDLGLSQEQLAERIGETYCQSDISRLERGLIAFPRLSNLERIAASLDVPVGDLLIAAGWFQEGHFVSGARATDSGLTADLESAVSQIEAELDAIRDMERLVQRRTDDLRLAVRNLKTTFVSHQTVLVAD